MKANAVFLAVDVVASLTDVVVVIGVATDEITSDIDVGVIVAAYGDVDSAGTVDAEIIGVADCD